MLSQDSRQQSIERLKQLLCQGGEEVFVQGPTGSFCCVPLVGAGSTPEVAHVTCSQWQSSDLSAWSVAQHPREESACGRNSVCLHVRRFAPAEGEGRAQTRPKVGHQAVSGQTSDTRLCHPGPIRQGVATALTCPCHLKVKLHTAGATSEAKTFRGVCLMLAWLMLVPPRPRPPSPLPPLPPLCAYTCPPDETQQSCSRLDLLELT